MILTRSTSPVNTTVKPDSPRRKRTFPYPGLLRCTRCECSIAAGIANRDPQYTYFRCTGGRNKCEQPYVREDRLGEHLAEVARRVHLPPESVETPLGLLLNNLSSLEADRARRSTQLRAEAARLARLKERQDRAYIDRLDGTITEERWRELEAG